jgi:cytochrome c biogenesis protein CcdA
MAGKRKTPQTAKGDLRVNSFDLGGKVSTRDLGSIAAALGPHAFAIVVIVASANAAVVSGANAYLSYAFGLCGIVSYTILALKRVAK